MIHGEAQVHAEILAGLKKIPYFVEVPDVALAKLADMAIRKHFPKNGMIINEGEKTGSLFIILEGKVQVFLSNEAGKVVTLSIQSSGSYFGELSLLDDEPRSASVSALEPSLCCLIPKSAFRNWLLEYPEEAALGVIRGLTRRIRVLTENVRGLALTDVYGRLVKLLRDLAVEEGEHLLVREKLSHQDLANMVGSSREMISKIMKDLSTGGYITIENRNILINRSLPASW